MTSEDANFRHLVLDIAWFGIALSATSRFLSVYAIRLGADELILGLLVSLPALFLLIATFGGTPWRKRYSDVLQANFLPALLFRSVFLLPAFTPFFPDKWQPWWLLFSVTAPALPQGIGWVVFIALMRESVNNERLTNLFSRRVMAMNAALGLGAVGFGLWLELVPFPLNYQMMFVLAYLAALVSLRHVMFVKPLIELTPSANFSAPPPWQSRSFQQIALLTLISFGAYFAAFPFTPLWLMNELNASEGFMAVWMLIELGAAALVARSCGHWVMRMGSNTVIALGMTGTALGMVIVVFVPSLNWSLLAAAMIGGSWAAADVGLQSAFVQKTPPDDVRYAGAFSQMMALAMFAGPLLGSQLAGLGANLLFILLVGAALRLGAGWFALLGASEKQALLRRTG